MIPVKSPVELFPLIGQAAKSKSGGFVLTVVIGLAAFAALQAANSKAPAQPTQPTR